MARAPSRLVLRTMKQQIPALPPCAGLTYRTNSYLSALPNVPSEALLNVQNNGFNWRIKLSLFWCLKPL